ncbi:MAG: DUF4113 domain-containing protein [Alphaproteobacteria bacterium]|nr:DUF4113 domain-containing protein [Alphaproteobacteria bacterium]
MFNVSACETIRLTISGTNKTWFMARNLLNPKYTTGWEKLRKVYF